MKKIIALLLITLSFSCQQNIAQNVKVVSPKESLELIKNENIQLVDVRTPDEYSAGHIEGSININYMGDTFDKEIEALDKTKPIVVYCRSGRRSAASANKLSEKGFKTIYDISGGIKKWESEGYQVTQ